MVSRGRHGEDGDPVRGRDRVETCGGGDVVRQGDVDYAAGRVQLRGEQPIGPLRLTRLQEGGVAVGGPEVDAEMGGDRKSTRLNSSHSQISYAVFCLKKKRTAKVESDTRHKAESGE